MQALAARSLRLLPPEHGHGAGLLALKLGLGPRDRSIADPALSVRLAGLDLRNCVGLAAGFDKDAEVPDAALRAGFGFVECGTVTPRPQPGNPRPRLFRLAVDRAVVNRMGFNGGGLDAFAGRLGRRQLGGRRAAGAVGANLGANKDSADRVGDYVAGLERLWGLADYFTVNVSSPNTPGLRSLQMGEALMELLERLREARTRLAAAGEGAPVFLKIAPDLTDREVEDVAIGARAHGFDGLILGNTTLDRPEALRSALAGEAGGLSGAPLMTKSTEALRRLHQAQRGGAGAGLVLIGCGGVASGADAYAKIRAGASAVQLYTALVYQGLGLVQRIKRDLALRLRADGFASVAEAVGTG